MKVLRLLLVAIVGFISLPANLLARHTEMLPTSLVERLGDKASITLPAQQMPPKEFFLYPEKTETIPEEHTRDGAGNLIVAKVTNPTLTAFMPSGGNTNKSAVIICPGGGYTNLHIQREGYKVAEAFSEQGVTAFVLKYRLPDEGIVEDKAYAPLKDAQRAVQLVRENSGDWGIDPGKIYTLMNWNRITARFP